MALLHEAFIDEIVILRINQICMHFAAMGGRAVPQFGRMRYDRKKVIREYRDAELAINNAHLDQSPELARARSSGET